MSALPKLAPVSSADDFMTCSCDFEFTGAANVINAMSKAHSRLCRGTQEVHVNGAIYVIDARGEFECSCPDFCEAHVEVRSTDPMGALRAALGRS